MSVESEMSSTVLEQRQPRDSENWGLLVFLVVASFGAHLGTIYALPTNPPVATKRTVEMELYEPPPPPPPKVEEPEPPKPEPKKAPPPVVVKVNTPKPPPPPETPPPPNDTPPPEAPTKPVPIVIGISMNSTSGVGTFAVQAGNSTYGKASNTVVDPANVKPYAAPKYAPPGSADSEPVVTSEYHEPYPEEAKKAQVEGIVRLKLTLDPEGVLTNVVVITGPGYGLNEAAVERIKKYKFKPAMKGGEPVGYTFIYSFRFELD